MTVRARFFVGHTNVLLATPPGGTGDLTWTMCFTHEPDCGPYFARFD